MNKIIGPLEWTAGMKGKIMSDKIVKNDQVVSMEYTLRVDGKVLDSSDGQEPLEFLTGAQNIISGLEREMMGMKIGESRDIVVAPADGYGEMDEGAFMDVPKSQFPKDMPLQAGIEMQVTDQDGNPMYARIESVEEDMVTLNFNHPLAGRELHFTVKVVGLRDATAEELEHGHAHTAGHNH
jgi:FKBP-type peptidyl-prolyl cis-trans isomerase SlyD